MPVLATFLTPALEQCRGSRVVDIEVALRAGATCGVFVHQSAAEAMPDDATIRVCRLSTHHEASWQPRERPLCHLHASVRRCTHAIDV